LKQKETIKEKRKQTSREKILKTEEIRILKRKRIQKEILTLQIQKTLTSTEKKKTELALDWTNVKTATTKRTWERNRPAR